MKTIVAIVVIGILVLVALLNGINGAVLASGAALIAGLGGYAARRTTDKK